MEKTIKFFAIILCLFSSIYNNVDAKVITNLPFTKNSCEVFEDNSIILPASTPVSLKFMEAISSEDVEIGNTVYLQVYKNVTVNNIVVIKAGSFAEGRISQVVKACNACDTCPETCSKVEILVETVQAIDGSSVYLNPIPHVVKGKCCGKGPTLVNIGAKISARVLDNHTVII